MTTRTKKVFWDSCVVIDAIQKTPGRWELIEPFLRQAETGGLQIVISEVNVAEILHLRRFADTGMALEQQAELIRKWLMNPFIVRRPVVPRVSELAAEIGRKHYVKGAADCIVVATALCEDIELIHTFDGEGEKLSNRTLLSFDNRIGSPPLRITKPDPFAGTIFDSSIAPNPQSEKTDVKAKEETRPQA